MSKYGVIILVLSFVLILTFPTMGACYLNPVYPYFSGPSVYGGVPFYTNATSSTLSQAVKANLSNAPYVSVSQSLDGGYNLAPGTAPMGQPIAVCTDGDLGHVLESYKDILGSFIIREETSGEYTYCYIYQGMPQAFSSSMLGSMPTSGLYGMPVSSTVLPTIPTTGISSIMPFLPQLGVLSGQSQGLVLPNVLIPSQFDYMTQLEQIFLTLNSTFPAQNEITDERSAHFNLPGQFITPGFPPILTPFLGMNLPIFPGPFVPMATPIFGPIFSGFGF